MSGDGLFIHSAVHFKWAAECETKCGRTLFVSERIRPVPTYIVFNWNIVGIAYRSLANQDRISNFNFQLRGYKIVCWSRTYFFSGCFNNNINPDSGKKLYRKFGE